MTTKSIIVLVHGALTGGSVWDRVASRLIAQGEDVFVPALPLRGLASDAAYLSAFLQTIEQPVVLAGHSYGGSVISHPSATTSGVKALVFVAAFAPDTGESTGELNERWPGSTLNADTIQTRSYPGGTDIYLKTGSFADVYAGDLPAQEAAVLARSQRPISSAALGEMFDGKPSWRSLPSWFLVATDDRSLVPDAQRAMATRANGVQVEVASSHAAPLSQPDTIVDVVRAAAGHQTTGANPVRERA